jgi:hypothetical protein
MPDWTLLWKWASSLHNGHDNRVGAMNGGGNETKSTKCMNMPGCTLVINGIRCVVCPCIGTHPLDISNEHLECYIVLL